MRDLFQQALNYMPELFALLFALITHEAAHGLVALINGDDTAKQAGRLTLNPLPHIDWMGLAFLLLFHFGWAKPVPINPSRFHHRRIGLFTTSAAGIFTNLLSAFLAFYLLFHVEHLSPFAVAFLKNLCIYGVGLAVFNLLPIPPLDGSKMLMSLLPTGVAEAVSRIERWSYYLLLLLAASGAFFQFLGPIIRWVLLELAQLAL